MTDTKRNEMMMRSLYSRTTNGFAIEPHYNLIILIDNTIPCKCRIGTLVVH